MSMKNLSHPGRIVLRDCIEALNLTIGNAAVHPASGGERPHCDL